MEDYYRKRAIEYEEIYHRDDPHRRAELERITIALRKSLEGLDVLEVACGTGYWTRILSQKARSITAVDSAEEMLEIARAKSYDCPVSLLAGDAYFLSPAASKSFTGGMANFWLSHVPRGRIDSFLKSFHDMLREGAAVFMADNVYVPGIGGDLVRREGEEDTHKLRELKDGSKHLVLKNYFSNGELVDMIMRNGGRIREADVFTGSCYWFLSYRT